MKQKISDLVASFTASLFAALVGASLSDIAELGLTVEAKPTRRGRPKGSKNKPKPAKKTSKKRGPGRPKGSKNKKK